VREIKTFENHGGIKIRFCYAGRAYNITPVPGGRWDNPDDRAAADMVSRQIAADIHLGNFDLSLIRYGGNVRKIRRGLSDSQRELGERLDREARADILKIWQGYRAHRAPHLAPTTLAIDYGRRMNFLGDLPDRSLGSAPQIRDWVISHKPPAQARKILLQLSAACDWARESGLIEVNPFEGMSKKVRVVSDPDGEINPFTAQERDQIIAAFYASQYFSHYGRLVDFLFHTGARPSEALGLEWGDVSGNRLTFRRTFSEGHLKQGLKTQKKRTVTLSERMTALLSRKKTDSEIIFPAPEGGRINWGNFTARGWRAILSGLPEIDYRNPKQTRHTFISLQIAEGVSPAAVARYCGNSPATIYRNYLGAPRDWRPS
jgi:integrase